MTTITGTPGDDILTGGIDGDYILAGDGNDFVSGLGGNDSLLGGAGSNTLYGGDGNDRLYGNEGLGADSMDGGAGNDGYWVDASGDVVEETGGSAGGLDSVLSTVDWMLSAQIENLLLMGSASIQGIGNALSNEITGNAADNFIFGGAGSDTITGGGGNDTLDGGDDFDFAVFAELITAVTFNVDADGHWRITTASGTDTLIGIEQLQFRDASIFLQTDAQRPTDLMVSGGSHPLNFVNDITALGDGGYMVAWGSPVGDEGDFMFQRFDDGDTAVIFERQIENMLGYDPRYTDIAITAQANNGFVSATKYYSFEYGGFGVHSQLYDADSVWQGDMRQPVNPALFQQYGFARTAQLPAGETVMAWRESNISGDDIFVQRLDSTGASVGSPVRANTTLTGTRDTPTIASLADNGYVVAWVDASAATHQVFAQRYDAGGNAVGGETALAAGTTLSDISGLADGGYVLTWSTSDQVFARCFNNDGVASTDVIAVSSDTTVLNQSPQVTVLVDGDFVVAWNAVATDGSVSDILSQRFNADGHFDHMYSALGGDTGNNLISAGTASDYSMQFYGGAGADTLVGGNGDDTLVGDVGDDLMRGGRGNDFYVVDSLRDVIVETGGSATEIDTVFSSVSWRLGDSLENLSLTGTSRASGHGNSADNRMSGNDMHNRLFGGGGDDTLGGGGSGDWLVGGDGDDIYFVDSEYDLVSEDTDGGRDTIVTLVTWTLGSTLESLVLSGDADIDGTGNAGDNELVGNRGANSLNGGDGDDWLDGRDGNNTMTGGAGADLFVFTDSAATNAVTDFSTGVDHCAVAMSLLAIGNGDRVTDGAAALASGGYDPTAELAIFQTDIVGDITAASAAAVIGDATGAMSLGMRKLFVVDNGTDSNLYLFTAADSDNVVADTELALLGTLYGVNDTSVSDYLFIP